MIGNTVAPRNLAGSDLKLTASKTAQRMQLQRAQVLPPVTAVAEPMIDAATDLLLSWLLALADDGGDDECH